MKRLCLVLLLSTTGCSFFMSRRPPMNYAAMLAPGEEVPCTPDYSFPVIDSALVGLGIPAATIGATVAARAAECRAGGSGCPLQSVSIVTMIVGGVVWIATMVSIQHGFRVASDCRTAQVSWRYAHLPEADTPTGFPAPMPASPAAPASPVAPALPLGLVPPPEMPPPPEEPPVVAPSEPAPL